jgi:hypothetical protein
MHCAAVAALWFIHPIVGVFALGLASGWHLRSAAAARRRLFGSLVRRTDWVGGTAEPRSLSHLHDHALEHRSEGVTAQQVRAMVQKSGRTWWSIHSCSVCGEPVGYIFSGDTVSYQNACGCRWEPNSLLNWQDVADIVNVQSREGHAQRFLRELSTPNW